jgi:hypothetical protein
LALDSAALQRPNRLIDRIGAWYCRHFHHGVINLTSHGYECAQCLRPFRHTLADKYIAYPREDVK